MRPWEQPVGIIPKLELGGHEYESSLIVEDWPVYTRLYLPLLLWLNLSSTPLRPDSVLVLGFPCLLHFNRWSTF